MSAEGGYLQVNGTRVIGPQQQLQHQPTVWQPTRGAQMGRAASLLLPGMGRGLVVCRESPTTKVDFGPKWA